MKSAVANIYRKRLTVNGRDMLSQGCLLSKDWRKDARKSAV
jgi:hypothetical protein